LLPFSAMTAKEHYDNHLANFYAWMVGDFTQKQLEQQEYFVSHQIFPSNNKIAFDLGAAHGLQTISLAHLGFTVKAVDFNKQLLNDLASRKENLPIEIFEQGILGFLQTTNEKAGLIVCMGDTLTHLEGLKEIELLFKLSFDHLSPKGKLILSFRDLTHELKGKDRFISVKSDESRILICFLEYHPDKVEVNDILLEKNDGAWIQKISSYPKLRVSEKIIWELLTKEGFSIITNETVNRMIHIVAEKKGG